MYEIICPMSGFVSSFYFSKHYDDMMKIPDCHRFTTVCLIQRNLICSCNDFSSKYVKMGIVAVIVYKGI